MPSETNCHKQVEKLAAYNVELLKQRLCGKYVFLVVQDSEVGSCMYFNVLIGDSSASEKTYFLHCSVVKKINHHVVYSKIDDALKKLDIEKNYFVLLLSDAAEYMNSCTAAVKILYPQLVQIITCLAHLLHNCAVEVCSHFPEVDKLITTVKTVTIKNKHRNHKFNLIGCPPQPGLTRWGTW